MGGVPTRSCRRFVRLLSEQCKLPVYAFTDCDPYGFANIYRVSNNTGLTDTQRPIMRLVASDLDIELAPGTYWLDFGATADASESFG